MSLYLGNNLVSGVATPTEPTRNLGQIIESLVPLTDAGLHLLDGALINGSGIYSAFVTYIAGLVSTYPNLFVTESDWQTSVTTYGVCGKFVYDSTNNTVRLPKITGKIDGTTDINALGDLVEQYVKLPNITGTFNGAQLHDGSPVATGAFASGGAESRGTPTSGVDSSQSGFNFNASRSSSVYSGNGTDTEIHEQAINVLYYIVIATTTKTEIEVDIDEIATDLNGKVDIADLQEVQCVVETYQNGASWYRVWSDGWCEQGGYSATGSGTVTINFLKAFADTNYIILKTMNTTSTNAAQYCNVSFYSRTTTSAQTNTAGVGYSWYAAGYIEV